MKAYDYRIIRSSRRTMAIEIKGGAVIVKAPYLTTDMQISSFVQKHRKWIDGHLAEIQAKRKAAEAVEVLTDAQIRELAEKARSVIPERVEYYASVIGVTYGRITIRCQRSRWGSCSSKGNLNFNCLLMLAPAEVLDSVVVHELCHRRVMNHSSEFYAEVLKAFPDYKNCSKWLKDNGTLLMARLGSKDSES